MADVNLSVEIAKTLRDNGISTRPPQAMMRNITGIYFANTKAVVDSSARMNYLEQTGTLTEQIVSPTSNLKSFSGFSETNFVRSSLHLKDLDFGTGDFTISGFFKRTADSSSTEQLIDIASSDGSGARIVGQIFNGSSIRFWLKDSSDNIDEITADLPPLDVWGQGTFIKRGQNIEIWLNGAKITSKTTTLGNMTNLNSRLSIGVKYDNTFPWVNAEASLIKIENKALSTATILEEYTHSLEFFNGELFIIDKFVSFDTYTKEDIDTKIEEAGSNTNVVTLPIVTGSNTIANGTRNVSINLSASSLLVGGNISSFKVDWNDGSAIEVVTANNDTATATHTYSTDKTDGTTLDISAIAIDNAGNESVSASHTFTYRDNQVPTAPSQPTTEISIGTTDVTFSGSTDADGTISRYEVNNISNESGVTVTTSTINSNTIRFEVTGDVTQGGSFSYNVYAVDNEEAQGDTTTVNVVIEAVTYNDCGTQGFGVGICPSIPSDMAEMDGTNDKTSPNYGNYIHPLSSSIMVWIPKSYYKIYDDGTTKNRIDYKGVATTGYVLERAFIDGGIEQDGVFVDKFTNSNSEGVNGVDGILASLKNQRPVSTYGDSSSDYNSMINITGVSTANYDNLFVACKSRGADYAVTSIFIYSMLARMALAHSQASSSTTYCAYKDTAPYLPKGCNNNALADIDDTSVTFTSSGYSNQALAGSASNLAKTSHNGQECGIIDLNGNMYEVASGLTNLSSAVTNSVLVLQSSQRLKDLVAGDLSSDAGYDTINIADIKANASGNRIGEGANQVFDSSSTGDGNIKTSLGFPLATGTDGSGTTEFGLDYWYVNDNANMLPIVGGDWSNGADAGVFRVDAYYSRASDYDSVGVRLCRYVA